MVLEYMIERESFGEHDIHFFFEIETVDVYLSLSELLACIKCRDNEAALKLVNGMAGELRTQVVNGTEHQLVLLDHAYALMKKLSSNKLCNEGTSILVHIWLRLQVDALAKAVLKGWGVSLDKDADGMQALKALNEELKNDEKRHEYHVSF